METPDSQLLLGAGMYDITGPSAEAGMFGYAKSGQTTSGIHMRLRARAFAFHCLVTSTDFVFVSADIGMITESVRRGVVEGLQVHPLVPKDVYTLSNVMLSAVHTHCAPGGLSEHLIYSLHPPLKGFDAQNFACVVSGIVESIARAYTNRQPGIIRTAKGECLGASVQRSPTAYLANPASERRQYAHDTDKDMVLWRLDGTNGFPIGMINWFAVHPTSMGSWYTLITGDNKGLASHVFEQEHGTNHLMDKPRSFVAAFAQSNEGDVSPQIHGPRNEATQEDLDHGRMLAVANAQLDTARRLYREAGEVVVALENNDHSTRVITGPLYIEHQYVEYGKIDLAPEWHEHKDCRPRTCAGCVGLSMLSGTTFDGRGLTFLKEGIKWGDYGKDWMTLVPTLQEDQKEKPVVLPISDWGLSPKTLPLQLVTIGSVALAAIPFEATTMAGRRLRQSITTSLNGAHPQELHAGKWHISETVIVGLANAYCGYMTTREEYAVQRYEGASTHFGPNQLSATKQQFDLLALAIRDTSRASPTCPPPELLRFGKAHYALPVIHDGILVNHSFGDVVKGHDVQPTFAAGDQVEVQFHAGHPKNCLRTQSTFLEIHRLDATRQKWLMHADDGDVNTTYEWKRWSVDASRVTIRWNIPPGTPVGTYRIKHNGDFRTAWRHSVTDYFGHSSDFQVVLKDQAAAVEEKETVVNNQEELSGSE